MSEMVIVETGWQDRRKKHAWQTMLTAEESAEIARIDAEVAEISARRHALSRRRSLIQNRALQRFKYANGTR